MEKKIEISGTIISLDDVSSISPIKKWRDSYKESHFEFSYKSYNGSNQRVVVTESKTDYYNNIGDAGTISVGTTLELTEIRDKVIKIISE